MKKRKNRKLRERRKKVSKIAGAMFGTALGCRFRSCFFMRMPKLYLKMDNDIIQTERSVDTLKGEGTYGREDFVE